MSNFAVSEQAGAAASAATRSGTHEALLDRDGISRNLIERVCVGDIATRAAAMFGDRAAIIDGARSLSFRDLDAQANRFGSALLGAGLARGAVVAVMARNCAEMLTAYLGCAKAGLICAPVNLGLNPSEIAFCLADAEARVLVAQSSLAALVRPLPALLPGLARIWWIGAPPDDVPRSAGDFMALLDAGAPEEVAVVVHDRDPVQILYTSGTTAQPKGVVTSHLAVTLTALTAALLHRLDHASSMLTVMPLFHCAQLNAMALPTLLTGATQVLLPGFDAAAVPALIARHRITHIFLLPMMYGALLQEPGTRAHDLSSVRRAVYAMAPMPQARLEAVHALFPGADVVLGSGQTEFTPPTTFQRVEDQWAKAASWGSATVLTRTAVMDDDGRLLPPGTIGELVYRGPQVMNGYLNQPEATAAAFRDGWFHSGDVAWIDEDGVVWFTDRKKDMIKTGGENVASVEVERCLMEHPAVAEAVAVGIAHERWGEAVVAAVIARPGAEPDEAALVAHCRARIAGFKVPKAVLVVEDFPRTATGKIQKHLLRERLRDTFAGGTERMR